MRDKVGMQIEEENLKNTFKDQESATTKKMVEERGLLQDLCEQVVKPLMRKA